MSHTVEPNTRTALRPLVDHFGYRHGLRVSVPVREVLPAAFRSAGLRRDVARALKAAVEGQGPCLLVDLHGMRTAEAVELLRAVEGEAPALLIVNHGKGRGVLRAMVAERYGAREDWALVGRSGSTRDRPGDAVAVYLPVAVAEALAIRLVDLNIERDPNRQRPRRRPRRRVRRGDRSETAPHGAATHRPSSRGIRLAAPALWLAIVALLVGLFVLRRLLLLVPLLIVAHLLYRVRTRPGDDA